MELMFGIAAIVGLGGLGAIVAWIDSRDTSRQLVKELTARNRFLEQRHGASCTALQIKIDDPRTDTEVRQQAIEALGLLALHEQKVLSRW